MQAESLLWASKAVMADSPKLFLYKIIHFSSQKRFEPKCGGDHFTGLLKSLSVTRERHSADFGFPERARIQTVKTNAQINEDVQYITGCTAATPAIHTCSSHTSAKITNIKKKKLVSYSGLSSRPQREIITSSLLNMHVINYASCYHKLICIGLSCIKFLSLPCRRPPHRCAE